EVCGPADHLRDRRGQRLERELGRRPAGNFLWGRCELILKPTNGGGERLVRQVTRKPAAELGAPVGRHVCNPLLPCEPRRRAALSYWRPGVANIRRYLERRRSPAEALTGALDLVGAQRRSVTVFGSGLCGGAEPDGGAASDQGRSVGRFRPRNGSCNC